LKNRFSLFFVLALLLLFAGCATQPSAPPSAQSGEAMVLPPVQNNEMSGNRAVVALLDRAQTDSVAGHQGAAEASLERALRIEPRNPWLWHQLAQMRLDQGRYAQAASFAHKSNSFAERQNRLQAANWQLIGKARVAQGDSTGGAEAFKRAAEFASRGSDSDSGFTLH
jgi:predicted Zn-dependent protease